MHCIIAGSRTVTNRQQVFAAIADSGFQITEVISGGAAGADCLGEEWARKNGVPVTVMRPEWSRLGKRAGMVRNGDMARYALQQADKTGQPAGLILVWDGVSKGSYGMLVIARSLKLQIFEHIVK